MRNSLNLSQHRQQRYNSQVYMDESHFYQQLPASKLSDQFILSKIQENMLPLSPLKHTRHLSLVNYQPDRSKLRTRNNQSTVVKDSVGFRGFINSSDWQRKLMRKQTNERNMVRHTYLQNRMENQLKSPTHSIKSGQQKLCSTCFLEDKQMLPSLRSSVKEDASQRIQDIIQKVNTWSQKQEKTNRQLKQYGRNMRDIMRNSPASIRDASNQEQRQQVNALLTKFKLPFSYDQSLKLSPRIEDDDDNMMSNNSVKQLIENDTKRYVDKGDMDDFVQTDNLVNKAMCQKVFFMIPKHSSQT